MESKMLDGRKLLITLPEKVNTSNAQSLGEEIKELIEANKPNKVILNATDLVYISSTGLRVILQTKKMKPETMVAEVSPEIYAIFSMTGFTDIMDVALKLKQVSVDGCELLGSGKNGSVYRLTDDSIIKVYNEKNTYDDISHERELTKKSFVAGIPTALSFEIVKVGDNYGTLYELINADSMIGHIKRNPESKYSELDRFIALMKQVHELPIDEKGLTDQKGNFIKWADELSDDFSADENKKLMNIINSVPDSNHVIHGDFHMGNIMETDDDLIVIDMDTLGFGDPVFEMVHLYCTLCGFRIINPEDDLFDIGVNEYPVIWKYIFEGYYEDEEARGALFDKVYTLSLLRLYRYALKHNLAEDKCNKLRAQLVEKLN